MARKLTTREWEMRKRAQLRRQSLKNDSPAKGLKKSLQEINREVIARIEGNN